MISEEFVRQFLWTGALRKSGSSAFSSPPNLRLPRGILCELNSLVSLAFSNIERACADTANAFLNVPLQQKCAVISCPQFQGTQVIDAAVRHIAGKQDADVLVLDALELACGKFGVLGPEGELIDKLYHAYECGLAADKSFLDDGTLRFFEDLLTVSAPTSNPPPLRRRIIYMRDFQFIDAASMTLLTYILHSLYHPFAPNYPPDPYAPVRPRPQPSTRFTPLLVFGSNWKTDNPLFIGNQPSPALKDHPFLSSLLTHTHSSISTANNIPQKCPSTVGVSPPPFDPGLGTKVTELVERAVKVTVFAANVKAGAVEERWQKDAQATLFKTLNRAIFRACLDRGEHCMGEYPYTYLPLDLIPGCTILGVPDAVRVASVVMSFVGPGSNSREPSQWFEACVQEAFDIYKRAERERSDWQRTSNPLAPKSDSSSSDTTSTAQSILNSYAQLSALPLHDILQGVSPQAHSMAGCIVDVGSIVTTFDDVFVDPETVESLQTIISLPLLYPSYFNSGILAKEAIGGILLYGPPGTGKTMLCRALAKSSHARMLHIQPSDINDKWFGEAEKRVSAVFELAYRLSPCIVFIDEIDALFSCRNDETRSCERNVLTEFMQGMDGLRSAKKNRDSHVVVVGATNRPYDLDHAVLRRMPRRILVDIPSRQLRLGILSSYLRDEVLDSDVSIDQLATDTEGFSGSDLKDLCVAAALASVKQAIGPQWKERVSEPLSPINADAGEREEGQELGLPVRRITTANICQARLEISKSITRNPGDRLQVWHSSHSTGDLDEKPMIPGPRERVRCDGRH